MQALLRWRFAHHRIAWPRGRSNRDWPRPPATVAPGHAALTFIGHASFLIKLPGLTVLTDPIFSDRCSPLGFIGPRRARPPGLALADLPRPDVVLVSHNHYDHLDIGSLRAIARRHHPVFVTTLGNARTLRRAGISHAVELDWWQASLQRGARITATPARHFAARGLLDRNRTLWAGFMIETTDGRVFFAGDSAAGPHWRAIRERLGAPDLALLPIGAYEPRWFMHPVHMNPGEAVDAHRVLGAKASIGMHFGTFQLTDEAIDAPIEALAASRGDAAFDVLDIGETRIVELK